MQVGLDVHTNLYTHTLQKPVSVTLYYLQKQTHVFGKAKKKMAARRLIQHTFIYAQLPPSRNLGSMDIGQYGQEHPLASQQKELIKAEIVWPCPGLSSLRRKSGSVFVSLQVLAQCRVPHHPRVVTAG